jgi:hypothetical protein
MATTDNPAPLDPDEVECPKCLAPPTVPCRQPNGHRSRTVHMARRHAAARGERTVPRANLTQRPAPKKRKAQGGTFNPETASAAARKSAQARKRRAAEAAAQIEAKREEAERIALENEAVKLAEDAVRYAKDRAIVRRQVLDAALKAHARLIESLEGLQVVKLDEDGRPELAAIELDEQDSEGRPKVRHVPDVRGAYSAATIERLAKVAASTLNGLRLEEGKATGIQGNDASTSAVLGEAGVEELLEYARKNLPQSEG